ncbi:hypothetical protein RE474_00320 [Methanolobus sediminis]|uniref:DUF3566 domain-containing protein n=1 Tax=Methanolobus sediminis TaxID=3072978 RepID=A0AA51YLR9_9EURY|nr:hypothetical protein [Methanolobus sediminis]WMW25197.1 hypothetical protein RE474_00320 [Methanolobus sediminis]
MKNVNITKINPLSLGKVIGLVTGVIGFFFGLTGILFMGAQTTAGIGAAEIIAILSMVLLAPVIYGIMGFITGLIAAIIFNAASGYIGGLEMEIEEV